jgi:hypothetical protein
MHFLHLHPQFLFLLVKFTSAAEGGCAPKKFSLACASIYSRKFALVRVIRGFLLFLN